MKLSEYDLATTTYSALTSKGFETSEQFLDFLPKKCLDYTKKALLKDSVEKDALICGTFISATNKHDKVDFTWYTLSEIGTNNYFRVCWFGQKWRMNFARNLKKGTSLIIMGKVEKDKVYGYQITNPDNVLVQREEDIDNYARCIPKYRKIRGMSDEMGETIRELFIKDVKDPLSFDILNRASLPILQDTYRKIHFPHNIDEFEEGLSERRFRELLDFSSALKKTYPKKGTGFVLKNSDLADDYIKLLPYKLTEDQEKTVNLIKNHAVNGERMRLLIQGDVSCGKTVVAIYSLLLAVGNGMQAVLIAPTTTLAHQHYEEIQSHIGNLNYLGYNLSVAYLSSEMKSSEKKAAIKSISDGTTNIIVGTHSAFADMYYYKSLGTVVVDEEHKFGVEQREKIKQKAEEGVHVISMSATPIPRTLASVLYGDSCEIATIKSMPKGRVPVKTAIIDDQEKIFRFAIRKINEGDQVYVICPRVDEDDSEKASVEEALKRYEDFFSPFGIKCGCIHGKMKKKDTANILSEFTSGNIKILISTTVIEVGVNVPTANVIIIENAEMFGLASLHQLRGRVGRGKRQGYCILKSEELENERLTTLRSTTDGFVIAEKDLEMRGTGDLLGTEQTGVNRLINMTLDYPEEYEKASKIAEWMISRETN